MITPYTAESLKDLSWEEVRTLHTSLKLRATAKTRTRHDYETRILESQPQKVEVEQPIVPAKVTKCSECPFARPLDNNRYICAGVRTASSNEVVRGHWEITQDCERFLRSQSVDPIAPAETEIAPHRSTCHWKSTSPKYVGVEPLWCDRQCARSSEPRTFTMSTDKRRFFTHCTETLSLPASNTGNLMSASTKIQEPHGNR
ncbi:MAG: hypothetical protein HC941_30300 [Microcoleus sp. SU_5_3]|nr:hypothetical protein [Microcoleus sp. SU_5_3]